MNKKILTVYIIVVFLLLILPFAGMGVAPTTQTTENKELKEFPVLFSTDGGWNHRFLSDMGEYFEDHFAFRQELVSANAILRSKVIKTSPESQVLLGSGGWLYYSETTDDYQGTDMLSDRSLYNIAHTLSMMQDMTEALGSKFYYTVSPNKNSLYDAHMPYYYKKGSENNLDRLMLYLAEEGVSYIDLKSAFLKEEEVLYLKRDSHWNNKGAVLAYNTILDALGKEHESYLNIPYEENTDYLGDLNTMLYPLGAKPELNYTWLKEETWQYTSEEKDVEGDWISAANPQGTGSVLMYRDSFGNTLFPLFADEFENTYYTKLVPYSLADIVQYKPDYVVVERVERRISSIIEEPPIMQGPAVQLSAKETVDSDTSISTRMNGSYYMVEGIIDPEYIEEKSRIYISVYPSGQPTGIAWEAYGTLADTEDQAKRDCGYQLYLLEKNIPQGTDFDIEVIVSGQGGAYTVQKKTITNE